MKNYDYTVWCTYHDKKLIDEYDLKENEHFKLFYTKDENLNRISLNYIQLYLNEYVTQYYVWKNQIKSDIVGFCHYRRNVTIDENVFKNILERDVHYFIYEHLRFADNIKDEWLLGGLNIHVDMVKQYINENNKFNKFANILTKITSTHDHISFCEMYMCKWEKFNELMEFIEGYIHYLFKNILHIQHNELTEYTIDEYDELADTLNNTNWDLFKQKHIEVGDWDDNNPFPFYGGKRAIGFLVEMLEGLFWELDYELKK